MIETGVIAASADGFVYEGTYPEGLAGLIPVMLQRLASIETEYEREHDRLAEWAIPEILRCQLLHDLEIRHGLERQPYLQRLAEVHDRLLAETFDRARRTRP